MILWGDLLTTGIGRLDCADWRPVVVVVSHLSGSSPDASVDGCLIKLSGDEANLEPTVGQVDRSIDAQNRFTNIRSSQPG